MSGKDTESAAGGRKKINLTPNLKQKFNNALKKLKPTLPTRDGQFTPDVRQVGLGSIQGDEFAKFVAGDRSQFQVYGMDEAEREAATLIYDDSKSGLVASNGELADVKNRVYNVTKDGRLIYQHESTAIGKAFHHSSITQDAAVTCAGYITVENGKIKKIDTSSGHYQPTELDLYNALTILSKQGDVFASDCMIGTYASGARPLQEFREYMNENVSSSSHPISRVEQMRLARIGLHEAIGNEGQKVKMSEASTVSESVLATDFRAAVNREGKYLYQFPKELFNEEYIAAYAFRVFGEAKHETKIKSISLTGSEMLDYLRRDTMNPALASAAIMHFATEAENDKSFYQLAATTEAGPVADLLREKALGDKKFLEGLDDSQISNILKLVKPEIREKFIADLMTKNDKKSVQTLGRIAIDARNKEVAERLLSPEISSVTYDSIDHNILHNIINLVKPETSGRFLDGVMALEGQRPISMLYKYVLSSPLLPETKEIRNKIGSYLTSDAIFPKIFNERDGYFIANLMKDSLSPADQEIMIDKLFTIESEKSTIALAHYAKESKNQAVSDKMFSEENFDNTIKHADQWTVYAVMSNLSAASKERVINKLCETEDIKSIAILDCYSSSGLSVAESQKLADKMIDLPMIEEHAKITLGYMANLLSKTSPGKQDEVIERLFEKGDEASITTLKESVFGSYLRIRPDIELRVVDRLLSPEMASKTIAAITDLVVIENLMSKASPEVRERMAPWLAAAQIQRRTAPASGASSSSLALPCVAAAANSGAIKK